MRRVEVSGWGLVFGSLVTVLLIAAAVLVSLSFSEGRSTLLQSQRYWQSVLAEQRDLSQTFQRQLLALQDYERLAPVEDYQPARWLSRLNNALAGQPGLSDLSARVVEEDVVEIDRRGASRLLRVHLELNVRLADETQLNPFLQGLGRSLGSYVSVDHCQLREQQLQGRRAGLHLRCRMGKVALAEVQG